MLTTLVGLIAFASPDKSFITPKSLLQIKPTYHTFYTGSNPASVTKSMGLSADALLSWFLHRHLPIFTPGAIRAVYRDSVILTIYHDSQLIATYRDYAKTHANPDTDGN